MDRSHIRSRNTTHIDCKGTQKIVDDPRSSPHSLLPWLKRQLQTFVPTVNNVDYNPTLPTAS